MKEARKRKDKLLEEIELARARGVFAAGDSYLKGEGFKLVAFGCGGLGGSELFPCSGAKSNREHFQTVNDKALALMFLVEASA